MRREQKFDPVGITVRGWLAVQKCVTFMQVCLGERDGMQFRDDIGSAEMGSENVIDDLVIRWKECRLHECCMMLLEGRCFQKQERENRSRIDAYAKDQFEFRDKMMGKPPKGNLENTFIAFFTFSY